MQTVSKTIKYLMGISPYYGIFCVGLNKRFADEYPTLWVSMDGINYSLNINREYWNSLTNNQRIGGIWHELLHIVLFHLPDYQQYIAKFPDAKLLNIAMDLSVESYIPEIYWDEQATAEILFRQFKTLPKCQSVEYYWNFLKSLQQFDSSKVPDPDGEYSGQLSEFSQKSQEQQDYIKSIISSNNLHQSWNDILSSEECDKIKDLVKNQVEFQMKETAKSCSRGIYPSEIADKIRELLYPKPPIFNWKAYFRRVLGISFDIYNKKTRRKESKRFSDSPGLKLKKKHKILVGIDTSGSVNSEEFSEFFNEIKHIYKAGAEVYIIECDTKISAQYAYKGKTPEVVHGRGGTSFLPVVDFYNKSDYTTCVYFTDGYGDQDECTPTKPMIWIITSNGAQGAKYPGMKICIPQKK